MPTVLHPPSLGHVPDIRLIAVDMDGTLLDDEKQIHDEFWPLLDELAARGIALCPASGRQFAALRRQIGRPELVYIAENGAYVVRDDTEVSSETLSLQTAHDAIRILRSAHHLDTGTVLCGKRSAYVERTDDVFLAQVHPYYARLELVDDLIGVDDEILKVAVHDFGPVEQGAGALLADVDGAVVSGEHWVDLMNPVADKGLALRHVQDSLGVTREQTMAFGDYLNDVGLLDAAHWSFAMDNAHPDVRAHARFVAPANTANGVVRTIRSVLGLEQPS
ncbi:Cof-type HAD-IIB family hydrolase [Cellulomonas sp. URHE0023]|uniref:Cof-type HAD-IIB family hydrolase n=1 Tax=Cellulomonas sp. URHE0023 TaxID=1380354 RepID=UPI000A9884E4|nr:HAD family hydrolase [Cellulomonas sp. URHE0023]